MAPIQPLEAAEHQTVRESVCYLMEVRTSAGGWRICGVGTVPSRTNRPGPLEEVGVREQGN